MLVNGNGNLSFKIKYQVCSKFIVIMHAELPHHVRNVMLFEYIHCFLGAIWQIGRTYEDHIEPHRTDERDKWQKWIHLLGLNAEVVQDLKKADGNYVKHNENCRHRLRRVEVDVGARVVEVEQFVNRCLLHLNVDHRLRHNRSNNQRDNWSKKKWHEAVVTSKYRVC